MFYHILVNCNKKQCPIKYVTNNSERQCPPTVVPTKSDSDVMFCLQS